jgi:hypothetical protein
MTHEEHLEPIAIVGLSCRLPQAADTAQYWQLHLSSRRAGYCPLPHLRAPGTAVKSALGPARPAEPTLAVGNTSLEEQRLSVTGVVRL